MLSSRSGILAKAINTKILKKNHPNSLHSQPDSQNSYPNQLNFLHSQHSHPHSLHSHLDSLCFHPDSARSHHFPHSFPKSPFRLLQLSLYFIKEIVLAQFQNLLGRSNRDEFWENDDEIHGGGCVFFVNLQFAISQFHYWLTSWQTIFRDFE